MKRLVYATLLATVFALTFSACKTSEENYRKAYEIAKAKQYEGLTEEEITAMEQEAIVPKSYYKGDSIPYRPMYVKWDDGGVDSTALKYNVVVADFTQLFNARSVMSRLQKAGYRNAVVMHDKDNRYYVGAVTTASLDSAVVAFHALEKKSPLPLKTGYPYILAKAR
jgi:hypothetical protein